MPPTHSSTKSICRFGDLIDGGTRNGVYKQKQFHGSGVKVVNMGELFANPRLRGVPMKRIQLTETEINKSDIRPGDLLFARRSLVAEGAGKCIVVMEVNEPTTFESSIIRARPKQDIVDSLYLYYFFNSPLGLHSLGTIRRQVAVSGITGADLIELPIQIPSLTEQKRISCILGALDDKIELNRKMNETLEHLAKALFKSWFIDFDPVHAKAAGRQPAGMDKATANLFPGSFVDSELGKIPKGWTAETIKTSFKLTMGQSPPGETYSQVATGLPFYQGSTDFGFRFPERRIFCTAPTRLANKGDTLVSVRAPVGDINMASEACCIGRGVAAVRHNSGATSFTYHTIANLRLHFEKYEAEGTVFGSINKEGFENIPFVAPSEEIVASYERLASPLDEEIQNLEIQSRTLASTRDWLLSKLLSCKPSTKSL